MPFSAHYCDFFSAQKSVGFHCNICDFPPTLELPSKAVPSAPRVNHHRDLWRQITAVTFRCNFPLVDCHDFSSAWRTVAVTGWKKQKLLELCQTKHIHHFQLLYKSKFSNKMVRICKYCMRLIFFQTFYFKICEFPIFRLFGEFSFLWVQFKLIQPFQSIHISARFWNQKLQYRELMQKQSLLQ